MCRARIAFAGPAGTSTRVAVRRLARGGTVVRRGPTVDDVVGAVATDSVDAGVVPAEDGTGGSVPSALELLVFHPRELLITEEVTVPISFDVYRRAGDPAVAAIGGHARVLAQCGSYVRATGLPVALFRSTTEAVTASSCHPDLLVAAASGVGEEYGLSVVASNVADHDHPAGRGAIARFIRFAPRAGREGEEARKAFPDERRIAKTTLAITSSVDAIPDPRQIGSSFHDRGLRVASLACLPLPGYPGTYVLVLTLSVPGDSPALGRAVMEQLWCGHRVRHLGSYPADPDPWQEMPPVSPAAPPGSVDATTEPRVLRSLFPGLGAPYDR